MSSIRQKPVELPPLAAFELRFKGIDAYQLVETRFQFTPKDTAAKLKLTNNRGLGFQWTAGVKGFSACMVMYVQHSLKDGPSQFEFTGPVYINPNSQKKEKSPASSLGEALGKKTIWVQWMFKSDTTELSQVMRKIFGGNNLAGKNKNRDVEIKINHTRLPPNNIKIFLNDSPVTTAVELDKLLLKLQGLNLKNLFQKHRSHSPILNSLESTSPQAVSKEAADLVVKNYIGWIETWKRGAIKSATRGDAEAQFNLGYCYENGIGVKRDISEAIKWYQKAAGQNDYRSFYKLGILYGDGIGVKQDIQEAIKWFGKSAEHPI